MPFPLPAGLAFFFEILLPGVLGGIVAYPLFPAWAKVGASGAGLLGFISLCLLMGVLPRLASYHLWMFWTGIYWNPRLRRRAVRNLQFAVSRAEAALTKPKIDLWTRMQKELFLDAFLEGDKGKVVLSPTVLGNGLLVFVIRFHEFFHKGPAVSPNQITSEDLKRLIVRAWFSLPQDVRSELGEGIAVGSGLLSFSIFAALLSIVFIVFGLLGSPIQWSLVIRGLVGLFAARTAHLIGRWQVLSGLEVVRTLLQSRGRPEDTP